VTGENVYDRRGIYTTESKAIASNNTTLNNSVLLYGEEFGENPHLEKKLVHVFTKKNPSKLAPTLREGMIPHYQGYT